ncbi:hypothetical protein K438DRAFT_1608527, partial [Mycena galopus ATCC 62051]
LLSSRNLNIYLDLVAFSLLFYDFFLTLDVEISRYWNSAPKFGTLLFFANRYVALLGNIPVVIENLWTTPIPRCQHLETYHQYFIIVTQLLVGLILLVRTYALYHRSKRVLAFMIFVAVVAMGIAIWSTSTGHTSRNEELQLYIGCTYPTSKAQGISLAIPWACLGVFDFTMFVLTLCKGLKSRRPHDANFLTLFLRDGITTIAIQPYTRGICTTFTNIISSLIVSRLMLNLRDPSLLHTTPVVSGSRVVTDFIFITPQGAPGMHVDAGRSACFRAGFKYTNSVCLPQISSCRTGRITR